MPKQVFDVCIVGSGPGGGIATYALAKAGLKVALVEAGPRLRAGIDYNSHGTPFSTLDQRLSQGLQPGGGSWSLFMDRHERNHFTGVGVPFTVTQSGDRAGVGGGTQRPNVVGTPNIIGTVNQYFNTAAFALAPLGQFGNEGVSVIRGPGISDNYTMNFYKNFSFHVAGKENQKLRIGAEFFNIFNHPNFSAVGAGFATATFGHVTAALDPREIQFSARLSF